MPDFSPLATCVHHARVPHFVPCGRHARRAWLSLAAAPQAYLIAGRALFVDSFLFSTTIVRLVRSHLVRYFAKHSYRPHHPDNSLLRGGLPAFAQPQSLQTGVTTVNLFPKKLLGMLVFIRSLLNTS